MATTPPPLFEEPGYRRIRRRFAILAAILYFGLLGWTLVILLSPGPRFEASLPGVRSALEASTFVVLTLTFMLAYISTRWRRLPSC